MFDNKTLCSICGGQCCKGFPGAAFPEDFGLPGEAGETKLRQIFSTGLFTLDWWEGDPRSGKAEIPMAYFVRPAIKGYEGRLRHASWGGTCTFLKPGGCVLPSEERPRNCRMLEPRAGEGKCILHEDSGKREAAIAWIPYTELLETL